MKNNLIDLHVHSVYSDGMLTPEELANRAASRGVKAIAITDHDTLSGVNEKILACEKFDIDCIIGVEISCELNSKEVHILSLFADPKSPHVYEFEELKYNRKIRMLEMLDCLKKFGIVVTLDDLPVRSDGVYGRPHLAQILINKGLVSSVNEAFNTYLRDDGPINIPKVRLSASKGIMLAKDLGGLAILAHPAASGLWGELDILRKDGLDGIEVFHPKHSKRDVVNLSSYAEENNLYVSGGSDFHSPGKGLVDLGVPAISFDILTKLRDYVYKG